MGDLLRFPGAAEPQRYRELLIEAAWKLEVTADNLVNIAVNAAMAGPWRAWADGQPEGCVVPHAFDAVRECGDERIVRLATVCIEMREAAAALRRRS